ncbi:TetR/AcrR family transcriptional regulator [Paramagnetospirillum kuznetsovii]|uniref:TetR/AcrR family transcriptional regulator n=1 Tax=Paramagnetospirillum kuznetsovii TaxID=2053833 RepID=A0A364NUC7_9PROT|nr:TetR/AcrR family transcriptional regulator [Paramagnetospirillum kuznetsovii]RAU20610.1 TetR/AcrR family transcriptional regulator [Paramagnetospirillum kuznetsovii]
MARTIGSHGPKTMEAIRKAGLKLIYEHGFEAMSLRQLASEVGIQVGSLYNHITTKEDLLYDLIKAHMDDLFAQFDEVRAEGRDKGPVERMRDFIAFHVTYHILRKREVFIGYSELRSLEPNHYEEIVALRRQYERHLIDILRQGEALDLFRCGDASVAAYGILSMLTGVCTWFRPHGRLSKEQVISTYSDLVLNGLMPPSR